MGRRHLLYLLYTSSVRPPASTPYFISPPPFLLRKKGYSQESSSKGKHDDETINHERAPSTLEEFKRLEEDKANQGVASQTVEKAEDGAIEATIGDRNFESVKESFKENVVRENVGVGDFRRTGEE